MLGLAAALIGCAPVVKPAGPAVRAPAAEPAALVMADGARLPRHRWLAEGPPRAILLGLHGFNDHGGNFMLDSLAALTAAGVEVHAYDQRGFGAAPGRGYWPGAATLSADAATAIRLLRTEHPGLPLMLLGESMGGAVALLALAEAPPVDRVALLTPAIWSRDQMGPVMRGGLWLMGRTMPAMRAGGGVSGVVASDNVAALRRLARDPLVIGAPRFDALIGLVDLMDEAAAALPGCCAVPTLLLAGAQDSVVPAGPMRAALAGVGPGLRTGLYGDGYHLLLAGAGRALVVADLLAFLADPAAPLPSGADTAVGVWIRPR